MVHETHKLGEDSSNQDTYGYGGYTKTDYYALRLIELKQQQKLPEAQQTQGI